MKSIICMILIVLCTASMSAAGVIHDARTGVYDLGDPLPDITAAEFFSGALYDALKCAPIHFTDGFTVTQLSGGNAWRGASNISDRDFYTQCMCGEFVMPALGSCYQGIRGIFDYCDGFMMILPDGVEFIDCSMPERTVSVGAVKSMY